MRASALKGASSVAIIVILIVAVVAAFFLIPGLTSNNGPGFSFIASPGTQGVVISSLKADQTSVEGGAAVDLELVVQNVGASLAKSVKAQLIGFSSSNKWQVQPTSGQDINGGQLAGADPTRGFKGDQGVVDWTLVAPPAQATSITYPGVVQVTYSYATAANIVLQVATDTFLKTSNTQTGITSQQYTLGPLSVVATVSRAPIISIVDSKPVPTTIPVQFDIENIGGGTAYGSSQTDQSVTITVSGVTCPGLPSTGVVRLISGKSRILDCSADVSDMSNSNPFEQKIITFTVNYNYLVQSTVSVTVQSSITGISPS